MAALELEKNEVVMQLDELSVLKGHSDDELKMVMDRSSDLYTEVTDLKNASSQLLNQAKQLR